MDYIVARSVLARQPSRAADLLLRSSQGKGGGPPLCIGKQEVGTYIYSCTYIAYGALGDFFEVFRLLMWWENQ